MNGELPRAQLRARGWADHLAAMRGAGSRAITGCVRWFVPRAAPLAVALFGTAGLLAFMYALALRMDSAWTTTPTPKRAAILLVRAPASSATVLGGAISTLSTTPTTTPAPAGMPDEMLTICAEAGE
jgi:hypothetical protein